MEKLDLRYYLYHTIEPIDYSKEDSLYERLELFLKTGYIYPGTELNDNLPLKYKGKLFGCDPYVFFALTDNHLLPKNITNIYGEESAFMSQIEGNLAFMFDEEIIKKFKIINLPGWLYNEVIINSKVPIKMVKAMYYPKESTIELMEKYKTNKETLEQYRCIKKYLIEENKRITYKLSLALENPETYMDDFYKKVDRIKEILNTFGYNIPIVTSSGYILDKQEETKFINDNYDEVKLLIKK